MPHSPAATFADLLRQHRFAAGLTQEALAERAGLSVHGVQKLEQGATHPYRDTVQRLVRALKLGPDEEGLFRAAAQPIRRYTATRSHRLPDNARDNLPLSLNSFVGREQELAEIKSRLADTRLLTLTGVGGTGKTRLALEIARGVIEGYPDGVWMVELGPLTDPALVPHQLGAVVGVREIAGESLASTLATALRDRRLLIVLDNCEHLLDACAVLVDGVLRACRALQVLATSREPLGIVGEVSWRVPPFPVPDPERAVFIEDLQQNPAVRLFVQRARAVQPRFVLTARNARAVAEICRRLDGIPLAIELAAAWVEAVTPEQLAVRLDQRFQLLVSGNRASLPRQQTLSATLDWSYGLLSKRERRLFERLAVFAGGWTVEAADEVCAGDGLARAEVLDLLARLVWKSLVIVEEGPHGSERYGFLETVHEYARQKLVTQGADAIAAVRLRHAAFYSDLAKRLIVSVQTKTESTSGPAMGDVTMDRLEAELDNLRAALGSWLDMGRAAEGLGLAATLGTFWVRLGGYGEWRRWVEAMLDLADRAAPRSDPGRNTDVAVTRSQRAYALRGLAVMTSRQGEYVQARAYGEASIALWRDLDDTAGLAHALAAHGFTLWLLGDAEQAIVALNESINLKLPVGVEQETAQPGAGPSLNRGDGNADTLAGALLYLGTIALWQEQYERAAVLFRESAAKVESVGWYRASTVGRVVACLGRVAYLQGDYEQARGLLTQALELVRENRLGGHVVADCLDWLAAIDGARGDPARGARLFGAADAYWRSSGGMRFAPLRAAYDRDVARVRTQLDEQAFAADWAEGQRMRAEQAIAYALSESSQTPVPVM